MSNDMPRPTTSQPRSGAGSKPTAAEVRARRLDALIKSIDWSHVVVWQVERLHQAERDALRSEIDRRQASEYRQEHRQPFSRLRAEAYFLLGSVRQLQRALDRFGNKKKVPAFSHGAAVLIAVRNAVEHWDGNDSDALAKHTDASWDDYSFGHTGTLIAGVLSVDDVAEWANDVQQYLLQAERDWR